MTPRHPRSKCRGSGTAPLGKAATVNSLPLPGPCGPSSASKRLPFSALRSGTRRKTWKTRPNSPQSVSIHENVLEPLLIPEGPDLPNLPDPPAPVQKPVVQIEVIHLVHENKPVGGRQGLRRKQALSTASPPDSPETWGGRWTGSQLPRSTSTISVLMLSFDEHLQF